MGLTYKGLSVEETGAMGRLLHGSSSSSSRLRLVRSKQLVDKSSAESSVSDKSSTFTSLSEPEVVSTTAAATATAVTAAAVVATIFGGLGAPEACCTANRRLVSVCSHFWIWRRWIPYLRAVARWLPWQSESCRYESNTCTNTWQKY